MHEKNTVSYALEWSYIDLVYSPQNCFFWPYTPLVTSFYFRKSCRLQLIWFVGKKTTEYDTTFYRLFSSNQILFPKVKRSIWIEILAITNHKSFTVFRNNKVTSKVNVMCYLHMHVNNKELCRSLSLMNRIFDLCCTHVCDIVFCISLSWFKGNFSHVQRIGPFFIVTKLFWLDNSHVI